MLKLGERDLMVDPLVERLLVLCRYGEPPRLEGKSSCEEEAMVASWTFPNELEQLDEARESFSGEHEALRLLAIPISRNICYKYGFPTFDLLYLFCYYL